MTKLQNLMAAGAAAALALAAAPAYAATTTVINFDDLTGIGLMEDGYAGLRWNNDFSYYDGQDEGFPTHSGATAIYTNYDKYRPGTTASPAFDFAEDVQFNGAWFSGDRLGVRFVLYLDGQQVHISDYLAMSDASVFLSSGYSGLVDRVEVLGTSGVWVMDDLTYTTGLASAVPEPAAWAMMIVGFGAAGTMVRSQRRRNEAALA